MPEGLEAWVVVTAAPEYQGISGHLYRLDFAVDRDGVLAITLHHASVSAAAKKLLDIRAVEAYAKLKIIVVVDDRLEREAAKREGLVLDSVASDDDERLGASGWRCQRESKLKPIVCAASNDGALPPDDACGETTWVG